MSESSGPQTVCKMAPNRWNSASAGKDIVGVRTKILDPDADGEGEVGKVCYNTSRSYNNVLLLHTALNI